MLVQMYMYYVNTNTHYSSQASTNYNKEATEHTRTIFKNNVKFGNGFDHLIDANYIRVV